MENNFKFYPAFITQHDNCFTIQFRNLPAISVGATLKEALEDTESSLKFALDCYKTVNGVHFEPPEFQHCDIAVQYILFSY